MDDLSLGFYRGAVKIGEEHHVDESCRLMEIHWGEDQRLVYPEWRRDVPSKLSAREFNSIVPPWLIEERIAKMGR